MKMIRAFAILFVFVVLSVIHLAIFTNSIRVGYEIDTVKKKVDALRNDNRYLNYLVAKEESLPRIEQIAKGKLNMSYPENINYIVISKSTEESH